MIFVEIAETISSSIAPEILQRARLERVVQAVLHFTASSPDASMTLLISDDDQLRQLNRQFLGNDETTDVLSFPAGYIDPKYELNIPGRCDHFFPACRRTSRCCRARIGRRITPPGGAWNPPLAWL
jgi:hypothetical protein